ncbi:EscU/YscU/HrcU family type III secretion system export apparatus switch protein [Pararoseomonas sp. SCSIO 73927]|uniref:EscU/YscU/HrcU family type III secretion system export apparatus switch protein n=1 Tax=Pararoseomonas sp. SCSIO 73927 TaxID=3114537 RepID=UPI0030D4A2C7
MSGGDSSEEKSLPATKKKLDDARKKGQVPNSKDLVSGATFAAGAGFLLLSGGTFAAVATALVRAGGEAVTRAVAAPNQAERLTAGIGVLRGAVEEAVSQIVLPLLLIVPGVAILASIVALRGLVFSMEPVTPKPEKINPVEGFKRIFSLRSLMEFLKSLAKTVLLAAALVAVLWGGLRALLLAPSCGIGCEVSLVSALGTPMIAAAILVFLAVGIGDLGLQSWLFGRDMRMSVTEQKRERKEQEGDPHVKSARRALMRDAATAPRGGAAAATLILHAPAEGTQPAIAIGVRFVRGETPVPSVVARGEGPRADGILERAAGSGIPVAQEAAVARLLWARTRPGAFVPQDLFGEVAGAMVRAGAI